MLTGKHTALPHRGEFGAPRPAQLNELALPPGPMPWALASRPLKRWRYVAFFSPHAIISVAKVRIGPLRDSFWSVWDRDARQLSRGRGRVSFGDGLARVRGVLELSFTEAAGVETICASGRAHGWTRKQCPPAARARLELSGRRLELGGQVLVDDTAAYYERHTRWRWSAGAGTSVDGRAVAWNLVSGVNDPPVNSERTVWVDGVAFEAPACTFAEDLSSVGELRFQPEAELSRRTNLVLIRSSYRQPLGRFSGHLPGGIELAEGYGVMEDHDAWW